MLTAKDEEFDSVLGLGSTRTTTSPSRSPMREFRSRIGGYAAEPIGSPRRTRTARTRVLKLDSLEIDFAKRAVEVRGRPIKLTYVEFEVLSVLAPATPGMFSRPMLLERIWGDAAYRDPRTIDVTSATSRRSSATARSGVHPHRPRVRLPPQRSMTTVRLAQDRQARQGAGLRSLTNKVALLFAGVVLLAFGVVYFYIVPQLRTNLEEQVMAELATSAEDSRERSRQSWTRTTRAWASIAPSARGR